MTTSKLVYPMFKTYYKPIKMYYNTNKINMNKTLTTQEIFELIKNNTEIEYLSSKFPNINIVRDIKEDGIRLWINKDGEVFNSYLFFTEHNNTIDISFNSSNTHPREIVTLEHINGDRDELQEILTTISCVVSFFIHYYFTDISHVRKLYEDYNDLYSVIEKDKDKEIHNDYIVYYESEDKIDFNEPQYFRMEGDIIEGPYRKIGNILLWILTLGMVHKKWFYKLKKVN